MTSSQRAGPLPAPYAGANLGRRFLVLGRVEVELTQQIQQNQAALAQEKLGEIPIEVANAVNPVVWASDIPGKSKLAESVSIALKPGATP
ncbi:hypothetical protein HGM15179_019452, partial [Zosterops borbonicus]